MGLFCEHRLTIIEIVSQHMLQTISRDVGSNITPTFFRDDMIIVAGEEDSVIHCPPRRGQLFYRSFSLQISLQTDVGDDPAPAQQEAVAATATEPALITDAEYAVNQPLAQILDEEMQAKSASAPPIKHLIVFQHGLGSLVKEDVEKAQGDAHGVALAKALNEMEDVDEDVYIYFARAMAHHYGGINTAVRQVMEGAKSFGEKLAEEITKLFERASPNLSDVEQISFVGASMGGLVVSHAVSILFQQGGGAFKFNNVAGAAGKSITVQPGVFVSLASPLLKGIRRAKWAGGIVS